MSMEKLNAMNGVVCACGKVHRHGIRVITGKGVISQLRQIVREFGSKKIFLLCDPNTCAAAGTRVLEQLSETVVVKCVLPWEQPEPDEHSVGAAFMHFEADCDLIIGVGSGVVNDIGKIVSNVSGKPYIIVATAPSMDGYASASSSMTRGGLKISLPSRSADVIIGDTEILCRAPLHMMRSGLGDMLAKYVSMCEWRISHLITGEYYCEEIAALIRGALKRCVDHADGLMNREEEAVQAVFEGLVIGGLAMNYAGLSRPASGVEHYISHVLDMRGAEFGLPVEFHGIQCAVGTLIAVRLYERLKTIRPNRETALAHAAAFDVCAWHEELRIFLGKAAESMIALEQREAKYDPAQHKARLEIILQSWEQILRVMDEELPSADTLAELLDRLQAPKTLSEIGVSEAMLPAIFRSTKDIRDKYVLSRLAWDLGIEEALLCE